MGGVSGLGSAAAPINARTTAQLAAARARGLDLLNEKEAPNFGTASNRIMHIIFANHDGLFAFVV
jgi:hypothetical protein